MAAGTAVAVVGVVWLQHRRDPNNVDPRTGVTTVFRDAGRAASTPVRFADATAAAGLVGLAPEPPRLRALPEDNGSGLAWGDFDADGWPDLYLVRHRGGNRLYHNQRDGTFRDVTTASGASRPDDWGMGATWVDFDGDGHLDLHVTNRGPNRLYRNRGDGTFVDVAKAAGVADPLWGSGTAWGDYDRDGDIDFYLCNYVTYDSDGREPPAAGPVPAGGYEAPVTLNPSSYAPQPNRLFRNRGDGTFEDVSEAEGVADGDGRSLAASFCDLDGNGWLDLYVNNDVSRDRLFRNMRGDGEPTKEDGASRSVGVPPVHGPALEKSAISNLKSQISNPAAGGPAGGFLDISAVTGTADPRGSMGLSLAETGALTGNADGLPDLFITHWVAQGIALYESRRDSLGTLEYRDKARPLGLAELSLDSVGWGCGFADFDLDGRVDVAVANGSTLEQPGNPALLRAERPFLFMNDGTGFRDAAPLAGDVTRRPLNARGLALADYDRDGRMDIALLTAEGLPLLLRNETDTAHRSLVVELRGGAARCFGAKIEVWSGGAVQTRWHQADVSYLSQHEAPVLFGLGAGAQAERIRVTWVDGTVTERTRVPAGRVILGRAGIPGSGGNAPASE